jgi:hypothetical protein
MSHQNRRLSDNADDVDEGDDDDDDDRSSFESESCDKNELIACFTISYGNK